MKYIYDEKDDEFDYYDDFYEYSEEGDELPYLLEHITIEKLYKEYIKDTSDDAMLYLMRQSKGGGHKTDD